VSSLETNYKKHEEFRQAMRARQLKEQEKRKSEKSETGKVNVPSQVS
jgi:hypothetical protein